jgi:putative SOS response-associated peptidase YedK
MCTRYLLLQQHLREVLARLGIPTDTNFISRYNITPGSRLPAVRAESRTKKLQLTELRWGLVPSWAKSDDSGTQFVNARAETLTAKPSFRDALRTRRCVIPASGFYEWEIVGRTKKPWLFRWRDERPFGLAGLWETWRAPHGDHVETCAVITTEPNELMHPIHHRMPVMLTPEQFEPWLDPHVTEPARLAPLLGPPSAAAMSAVPVSRHVSNVRHEGPACLAPAESDDAAGPQFSLGL